MIGRKTKEVDWQKYDELKRQGLKEIQIAIKFGMSQTTLCKKKRFRGR
ncbi:TPA: hypothetical protein ACXDAB_003422 [Clostridium botulinum]